MLKRCLKCVKNLRSQSIPNLSRVCVTCINRRWVLLQPLNFNNYLTSTVNGSKIHAFWRTVDSERFLVTLHEFYWRNRRITSKYKLEIDLKAPTHSTLCTPITKRKYYNIANQPAQHRGCAKHDLFCLTGYRYLVHHST